MTQQSISRTGGCKRPTPSRFPSIYRINNLTKPIMPTFSSHIIYLNDLKPIPNPSNPNDPDNKLYRYKLLAEGDSWFTVGGLPIDNVLKNLTFYKQNIILSLAKPGDTLKKMTDICNNPTWQKMTSKQPSSKSICSMFSAMSTFEAVRSAVTYRPARGRSSPTTQGSGAK